MGPTGAPGIDDVAPDQIIEFILLFGPLMLAYAVCIWQAGALAARRGRSRRKWTFRTVLFGPFALLALAILPSRRTEQRERSRRHRRQ